MNIGYDGVMVWDSVMRVLSISTFERNDLVGILYLRTNVIGKWHGTPCPLDRLVRFFSFFIVSVMSEMIVARHQEVIAKITESLKRIKKERTDIAKQICELAIDESLLSVAGSALTHGATEELLVDVKSLSNAIGYLVN